MTHGTRILAGAITAAMLLVSFSLGAQTVASSAPAKPKATMTRVVKRAGDDKVEAVLDGDGALGSDVVDDKPAVTRGLELPEYLPPAAHALQLACVVPAGSCVIAADAPGQDCFCSGKAKDGSVVQQWGKTAAPPK